jgi:predicted nicotinamide N-methyase
MLDTAGFLALETEPTTLDLVPEITLHLARETYTIFQSAEEVGAERPYWAFAWSGGQALARWLIDNPDEVAGRRVLDIGAGSGLTSIAAMMAGARAATANDTDPLACAAATLNAALNGVVLATSVDDLLATSPEADLILIGDLFYEPDLVTRVGAFLERAARRGTRVMYADRLTARRPPVPMQLVAEYRAPLTPPMEIDYVERARVWRLT